MKKKRALSKEEIEAKKEEFTKKAKEAIEEAKTGKRKSPAAIFLNEIKDIVKEMIDNGVSYTKIAKTIYDVYSFRISEQTVRAFAHSVLGVPKKQNNKAKKPKEKKTASQIKEEAAKKNSSDEDTL
jgi:transposase